MTIRTWHFYRLADGILTGRAVTLDDSDEALLQANTPPDCAAVAGVSDWQAQRVDLASGALMDWQPPQPADTALQTWRWDAAARRWLPVPTTAALAAEVRRTRDQRLAACDWVLLRALELAQPLPAEWATYRAALRAVPDQPGFPATVLWPAQPE
ncbi:tail fiber assembly protein [Pseudaquabacterium pictum]|uniref:Phage tail assembly chaperone-like domain-containing protein n=1 Tax=Pseudaquabacterium pictum TaxID=2315236 RepID=A0A480AJ46_9BURK|nr:tail fiber assembly protein [Rubrivivax pictus]GCL61483.1 hypothetical protein AQPW35_05640 [Rubrivivax pictus]